MATPSSTTDHLRVDSLTPLRLELIRAIAEATPESVREAARLVDRDISDVHSDLKQLDT